MAGDAANKWTDDQLAELESRFAEAYAAAYDEMRERQVKFLCDFESEREQREKALDDTPEARAEFKKWLGDQAARASWIDGMTASLAADATRANQLAMSMLNDELPAVYAENANYAAYRIDKAVGMDTMFTLVDSDTVRVLMDQDRGLLPEPRVDVPEDLRWNRQKFRSAITQGVLLGESEDGIAKRLQSVVGMNLNSAKGAARLAVTGAENAGRLSSYHRAQGLGIKLKKEWLATLDTRTRHSHRQLDGEQAEVDEPFSNGCMFPGDPDGEPGEIYGCRCTMIAAVDGVDMSDAYRWSDLPDGMTYEEWKNASRARLSAGAMPLPIHDIGTAPHRPNKDDYGSDDALSAARDEYIRERDAFIDRKEQLVNQLASTEPHGYETKEAALKWAIDNGVKITASVFENVDPRALDEIIHVNDELFGRYNIVLVDYASTGRTYAITLAEDSSVFMEATGGLQLNPSMFGSYKDACMNVVTGYTETSYNEYVGRELRASVRGDGTFRTTVAHEFGHNLDEAIRWQNIYARADYEIVRDRYEDELMALTMKYTTSDYSLTNVKEAFAEGFAEMECNPTNEYGNAFATFLARWL